MKEKREREIEREREGIVIKGYGVLRLFDIVISNIMHQHSSSSCLAVRLLIDLPC